MPFKRATIIRWTGKGSLDDLQSSVEFVVGEEGLKARIARIGKSIILEGPDPIGLAALLGDMPGVAWVAAGLRTHSQRELSSAAGLLAKRYLGKRDRFAVEAEGTEGSIASDIAAIVTAGILDEVKGSRVAWMSPKVTLRAAFDGGEGVVGVEVRRGQGGAPTGEERATCLVSGGIHSSVVAWEAVRQGYRVRLVHARYTEESLLAVARLYAELSHRSDPRGLVLEVLEGQSVSEALSGFSLRAREPVFAGYTAGTGGRPRLPKVLAPLYLMSEERFAVEYEALGLKGLEAREAWHRKGEGERRVKKFGGRRADVSGVLDGLE